MKIKGHGIVWDAAKNCILCRFVKGELDTEDKEVIGKLKKLGYEVGEIEESEEIEEGEHITAIDSLPFQELKRLCKEKGIEYDIHAKKDDLINLLKGAE